MKKLLSSLLLVVAAILWGSAFVAQSDAMAFIEPFTFNAVRSFIGCIVLLPMIPLFGRIDRGNIRQAAAQGVFSKRLVWICGGVCGFLLFVASNLQQFGIALGDSVGKAGFITALYIVLVPLFGLFIKQRVGLFATLSVFIATVGLYFLCVNESLSISPADALLLLSAVFFAIHILIVSRVSSKINCVQLSCIQFAVCGILSLAAMLVFESADAASILKAWMPLMYTGVLSCGVAYTLQIIGQRGLNPTVASLIMCLESVVAVLAGAVFLNQSLSQRELLGCGIMLASIVLAQLPARADLLQNRRNNS